VNNLPNFINQAPPHGDPQIPAPYSFASVTLRTYPLRANIEALRDICRHFLNDVSLKTGYNVTWEPWTNVVNLRVLDYESMRTVAPGYEGMGYSKQKEVILELQLKGSDGSIASFVPYCLVDNDWSLIAGREVLGYPKVLGDIRMKPGERIQVYGSAVDTFATESEQKQLPLLDIAGSIDMQQTDDAQSFWPFGPIDKLYGPKSPEALDIDFLAQLKQQYAGNRSPAVTLKQFRDGPDPRVAAYQSLVGFDLRLETFKRGGLLNPSDVNIYEYATFPARRTLGFDAGGAGIPAEFPWWMTADFILTDVHNLVIQSGGTTRISNPAPRYPNQIPGSCWDAALGSQAALTSLVACYADLARMWWGGWLDLAQGLMCYYYPSRRDVYPPHTHPPHTHPPDHTHPLPRIPDRPVGPVHNPDFPYRR